VPVTAEVERSVAHLGLVAGFLTVVLLLVLAAAWRRQVEPRVPGSTAAYVVSGALTASAAGLTYGYGWKGALAIYLPDGMDEQSFREDGLFVYFMLNDFGGFIGWLGVVVAAGAVAWMALRERTISRWIGWFSIVPVLAVVLFAGLTGLPGFQGVVGPAWMLVASVDWHGGAARSSADAARGRGDRGHSALPVLRTGRCQWGLRG
jgi:hypothetical protein